MTTPLNSQARFAASLHQFEGAESHLAIHRNNRMAALIDALAIAFPATQRIVGEEYFRAMAGAFVCAHPPRAPLLLAYGDELPAYIAAFAPAAEISYLADVARLEAAVMRAYHAADDHPLGVAELKWLTQEGAAEVRLALPATVFLLRSRFPAATLWERNLAESFVPLAEWPAEDVIVCRPALDVIVRVLPPGGADFLEALQRGHSIGEAAALVAAPAFDLPAALAFAFSHCLARPFAA
ncbi:MAG: DNA-binding domain-containing protein [Rhizomicrobium sp.]|nr:DNA-binding domain-containing protein [Rhizomicrobium sp.]